MTLQKSVRYALLMGALALAVDGCGRASSTAPWPLSTDPVVFDDTFGANVIFQAFGGSKLDALSLDTIEKHTGTTSIKISVPATGNYAGGAFTTNRPRDLTRYNALSFWVKGSRAVSLETAGFGNDNKGTSQFEAKRTAIAVTTAWSEVIVPIPDPSRLTIEEGMFFFAEGVQAGGALTLWIDDIRFVNTAVVTNPRPALTPLTLSAIAGTSVGLSGTRTVFTVSGFDQTVTHMPAYFDYSSSDASVGTVAQGAVHVLAGGTTTITARLGVISATGAITVNAIAPPPTAPPAPTLPAASVISLFSDSYPNVPVDTWSATWDQADVADADGRWPAGPASTRTSSSRASSSPRTPSTRRR